ncbi:MAG: ATP-dependent sacrificial sulfur transferase LarE [Desulfobacterales bacterium]
MGNRDLAEKRERLAAILAGWDSLAVAFSGGVDSTYLLAMARSIIGEGVLAITARSVLHPKRETAAAAALSRALQVRHVIVPSSELTLAEFTANPPNRCYICKKRVMGEVLAVAAEMGVRRVAHGAHAGDLSDYRPGLRAAAELGLEAPLMEAGLNQAEIRELSRRMKLPTWKKPSMACLASRIPYGSPITAQALAMVEDAEDFLRDLGLAHCRVRHHGQVARIEVAVGAVARLLREPLRSRVLHRLREIGFGHVAVDLEGYTMGSLNRSLPGKWNRSA